MKKRWTEFLILLLIKNINLPNIQPLKTLTFVGVFLFGQILNNMLIILCYNINRDVMKYKTNNLLDRFLKLIQISFGIVSINKTNKPVGLKLTSMSGEQTYLWSNHYRFNKEEKNYYLIDTRTIISWALLSLLNNIYLVTY